MSATVDTRVVQIQFDNKQFEQNVQQTIDSLERLNKALEGAKASDGIGKLKESLSGSSLGGIASGVDAIKNRFSTLGIVGMTVVQRLTNAGIDMATRIGASLTSVINQIKQGGMTRALNLEQAKFRLEGLGADIKSVMDDVNYAVEGTSYGLDEAAKAASLFFASGVKEGDQMKTALRGISGAAAMAGTEYSQVADIFQDGAAKQKIMTEELRRLEAQAVPASKTMLDFFNNINAGSEKVKDVPDDIKEAAKAITNGAKITQEDLEEMLRKGVITFDMFATAMDNAFGEHATKANETFQGALANTQTALKKLGAKFYEPGLKFGIDIFNEFREDINSFSTGIDGAAKAFSVFGKAFTGEFVGGLKELRSSGTFENIGKGISNIVSGLMGWRGILRTIKEAFIEVFPSATISNITKISEKFLDLTKKFKELNNNTVFLNRFKDTLVGFGNVFKSVFGSLGGVLGTVFNIFKNQFGNITAIVLNLSQVIGKVLSVGLNILNGALKRLEKPINYVMEALVKLSNAINDGFSGKGATSALTLFGKAFDSVAKFIGSAVDKITGYFKLIFTASKDAISNFVSVKDVLAAVGVAISGGMLVKGLKSIFDILSSGSTIKDFFEQLKEGILDVPDKISETFGALTDAINNMTNNVKAGMLKQIAMGVLALAIALKILSTLSVGELATTLSAVTILLYEMSVTMEGLFKMMEKADLKNMKGIATVTTAILKLGIALLIMAVALKIISTINYKDMAAGMTALVIMLGAVFGFVIGIDKYGSVVNGDKMAKVGTTIMGIAVALLILSASVKILSSMNIEELAKGLGSVVVLLAAIMGFIIGVSKLSSGGSAGMIAAGVGMIAIAAALNILVPVLQKLGSMDLVQLGKGLGAIIVAMGSMAIASQLMSSGGAAGMLIMAVSLSVLAGAIERLGNMDIKSLALGLGTLVVAIGAFAIASMLLSPAIPAMLGIAAAMLVLSTAIAILGAGLIMIGAGLAGIAAGITSFAALSQTAVMMFANTIQTLIVAIIQMFPQIAVALAESLVTFLEQIAELAPRFREAMTTIIGELIGAVMDNAPRIISAGLQLIIMFLSGVEEATPRIVDKAIGIVTSFLDEVGKHSEELADAGSQLIIDFINGLAEGIEGKGPELRAAILNLCTTILSEFMGFFGISSPSTVMQEQGRNLMQGLLNGIRSVGGIGSFIISAVQKGVGKLKSFGSKMKTRGGELIKSLGSGIKNKGSEIKTSISNAIDKAKNSIGKYESRFSTAGRNLVSGIAGGIRRGASSVISAAGSIASRALNAFKAKLGISSPSKVFMQESRWIPEGIAKGIRTTSRVVTKAVDDLANKTIDPFSSAIERINNLFQIDDDFNPTITPVLDLSNVEKEASGIGSLFGTQTVDLANSTNQNMAQQSKSEYMMNKLLGDMSKLMSSPIKESSVYNISIDGSGDPNAVVDTLIHKLKINTRTA